MNELFELVKERPDPLLSKDKTICPFCDSENITVHDHSSTMVGGDPDPNHHWKRSKCNDCKEEFVHEYKRDNVWYTKNDEVLRGIPTCFEPYIYTCNRCNGDVRRYHTALDGESPTQVLTSSKVNGEWIKQYRTFYKCDTCNKQVETKEDYYHE